MPTYHYRCETCSHEFEAFQSMMDDALTDCTECDGSVIRIIQPVGIQFKGTGFYINDHKASKSQSSSE